MIPVRCNQETLALITFQWCHNECDDVSNDQPHDCLLNRWCRCRSKKTSKLHVTGLCEGNSPVTGEFPAQRASNAENVSIWWGHHTVRQVSLVANTGTPITVPYLVDGIMQPVMFDELKFGEFTPESSKGIFGVKNLQKWFCDFWVIGTICFCAEVQIAVYCRASAICLKHVMSFRTWNQHNLLI